MLQRHNLCGANHVVNEALKPQRVMSVVTLLDLVPGTADAAPTILTFSRVRLVNGRGRTISEKVPVPDATLWRHFTSDVSKGDEIRITVETDWSDPDLATRLTDFTVVTAPLAPARAR